MQTLITFEQALELDTKSQKIYKIPASTLMESAGYLCTNIIVDDIKNNLVSKNIEATKKILIICGTSNNGGDGQVIARLLHELSQTDRQCNFFDVEIIFLSTKNKPFEQGSLAREQFQMIQAFGIKHSFLHPIKQYNQFQKKVKQLQKTHYLIDAITGVGQKNIFRYPNIINAINKSSARVISIDVPSGLPNVYYQNAPIVHANVTISMGFAKTSMYHPEYRKYCGDIKIVNPNFPQALLSEFENNAKKQYKLLSPNNVNMLWKKIDVDTYKHLRGITALAVGSIKSPGAAFLSLQAATRGPAGLVYGILDESIQLSAAQLCPAIISGVSLSEFFTNKKLKMPHSFVVGSGWGERDVKELESFFTGHSHVPIILDANALRMLPLLYKKPKVQKQIKILTPHVGELKHLYKHIHKKLSVEENDIVHMAEAVANAYNAIVVAKSALSYVVVPHNKGNYVYVIDGRCPVLATAGSGDVLAGLLGSCIAYCIAQHNKSTDSTKAPSWADLQKMSAFAVLLHAMAGEHIKKEKYNANAQIIVEVLSRVYSFV